MRYFIADLHLSSRSPGATGIFIKLLTDIARPENQLYILGDLFETWIGDDDDAPVSRQIVAALSAASHQGLAIFLLHGNRDFLIGARFAAETGVHLLSEPYLLSTPNGQFILAHGDALCTDDAEYQQFRARMRSPEWQAAFLQKPLAERRALAERLRQQSQQAKDAKSAYLMDLNPAATDDFLRQHGYATFIHGHTHRPSRHDHIVDGIHVERWVLADWSEKQGETLIWDGEQLKRQLLDEISH
ncbi:MAG: UDP-2,3-diacylglucosamine diphosphatase [Zoogloeaceae bacterium]|jgi:UDP-2,3-diacylglucosamine hydrolase|nr:UDP-2,3-diacylglucosamine diphosphatase [Zoogloeaceae bacterium]